jgi:hypothetical protein
MSGGLGIGVLPRDSVKPYIQSGLFRIIELNDKWALRPLVIVSRNFSLLPVPARMLIDHIKTYGTIISEGMSIWKTRIAASRIHLPSWNSRSSSPYSGNPWRRLSMLKTRCQRKTSNLDR